MKTVLLISATLLSALSPLQATASDQDVAPTAGARIFASAKGTELSYAELDELLLRRHSRSPRGREILRHLLEGRLVDAISKERGVIASKAAIDERINLFEEQVISSRMAKDLKAYLSDSGVDHLVFKEYMRLAILQESLTRLSLGVAEGGSVTGEQQTAWLNSEIEQRGIIEPWEETPPEDGAILLCPPVELKTSEFLDHLRTQLSPAELNDTCYHLLLARRIRARMPDTSPKKIEEAIGQEVQRRKLAAEADPAYQGVGFERLLASQGLTLASLKRDPSVLIAALSGLYIDEVHTQESLRDAYNTERAYFDGYYGEALGVRAILLQANLYPNEFVPRTFETAERELIKIMEKVNSEEDFIALAEQLSEAKGALAAGALHWMPKLDKQIGAELLNEAFSRWGGRPKLPSTAPQRLLGPRRTPKGFAVLWISKRRPAPAWEGMAAYVRQDLRNRFIKEVLTPSEVILATPETSRD